MSLGSPADLRWEEANSRYLKASLAWLRARLRTVTDGAADISRESREAQVREGGRSRGRRGRAVELPPPAPDDYPRAFRPTTGAVPDGAGLDTLAAARQKAAAPDGTAPPALLQLAERFGLTDFERDVLLLATAPAVDPAMGAAIAAAHGDSQASAPTFALALRLFDEARWDVLSPTRPLRRWRLVEAAPAPAQPLLTAPLCADDRIANLVRGLNHLDGRLASVLERVADAAPGIASPASLRHAEDSVAEAAFADFPDGRSPVVHLIGSDADSAALVAVRAFARLGRELYRLRAGLLLRGGQDPDTVALLWHRESLLLPVALFLDGTDADPDDPAQASAIRRLLSRTGGPVVLAARDVWPVDGRAGAVVDVAVPPPDEQRALWAAATGLEPAGAPTALSSQFRLGLPALHRIAAAHPPDALAPDEAEARLWVACRNAVRPRLEALAQRIVPRARWDDLVLPRQQTDMLRRMAGQVRHGAAVFGDWGFGERTHRGQGVTALFCGPSGTGKTFASEVLAHELGLDLYRVDLSAVVSKYIGETEKNLRRVFDAAECGGSLLLFDEADALFGRRSEVQDSHDRYANIEVSYLLQRMEAYRGVAVLATNLRAALDPAFLRRLRFVVEFPVPGEEERRRLWAAAFPDAVPRDDDLDLGLLADLPATGAAIQAIALSAAFAAAAAGRPVDTAMLVGAARAEFRKLDLPMPVLAGEAP
ncbi:AAA family ATPase [Streptomyces longispororuber]|uniref:AAA family ATPase n=1 Tax=Streptomyces longispororuber TaxID=68230 RepID=UPI00210E762B|nr:ATP-binding protein [Streptomyces longispororuber]MCQ4211112.1 ATP-binding protein [Streptomyces longispororuber]